MDKNATTALFLLTGLITACGTHKAMPLLQKARTKVVDQQYLEAIYTAERIIKHYPDTAYAESARTIIEIINRRHLDGEYVTDF